MRRKDRLILWPVYFDSTKTHSEGRRVPKKLAVPAPKLEEIRRAAELLGFESETVSEVAHPSASRLKTGLVTIPKKEAKTQITRKIAGKILENRTKK